MGDAIIHRVPQSWPRPRPHCCYPGCPDPAEFEIYGSSGYPDDTTEACAAHVGELLGTPVGQGRENHSWQVVEIRSEEAE